MAEKRKGIKMTKNISVHKRNMERRKLIPKGVKIEVSTTGK